MLYFSLFVDISGHAFSSALSHSITTIQITEKNYYIASPGKWKEKINQQ